MYFHAACTAAASSSFECLLLYQTVKRFKLGCHRSDEVEKTEDAISCLERTDRFRCCSGSTPKAYFGVPCFICKYLYLPVIDSKRGLDLERRKIQKVGRSTLSISLPREWLGQAGVRAGDAVYLEQGRDGILRILSESSVRGKANCKPS
jgi:hypothetical protein